MDSIDPAGVAGLSIIIEIQYFIKCKHKRTPCHKFFLDILYQFTTHLQKTRHVFVETLTKFIGDKGTNMRYNNSIRFGKDDELEKVKSALAAMDGDMSAFRLWQKQYDKLNRQWQAVQERYQKARQTTEQVHRNAKQLEEILVGDAQGCKKEAAQILKDWKRLQNGFDHEFLISKEDREFHSTYDTIVRLGIKAVDKEDQKLILQSEVENLIALLKENLEKEKPSAWKLCFYTLNHGEQELMELPPAEKLNCIDNTYQKEFLQPIIAEKRLWMRRTAKAESWQRQRQYSTTVRGMRIRLRNARNESLEDL